MSKATHGFGVLLATRERGRVQIGNHQTRARSSMELNPVSTPAWMAMTGASSLPGWRRRKTRANTSIQHIQSRNPPSCPPQKLAKTRPGDMASLRCFQMYSNSYRWQKISRKHQCAGRKESRGLERKPQRPSLQPVARRCCERLWCNRWSRRCHRQRPMRAKGGPMRRPRSILRCRRCPLW